MIKFNPKIDLVFKKKFGSEENKDLLKSLINSILPAEEAVVDLQIQNPYNETDYLGDKLVNAKIEKALVAVERMYFTSQERNYYEGRQKLLRDERAILQTAKKKAKLEGLEEGIEQGLEQGLQSGMRRFAKMMKKAGEPTGKIMSFTGLTREELKNL